MGKPGVMAGVIYYGPGTELGTISFNTGDGIFGTVNEKMQGMLRGKPLEIGYRRIFKRAPHGFEAMFPESCWIMKLRFKKWNIIPIQKNKTLCCG